MSKYSPSEQAIISALLRAKLAGRTSVPLRMLLSLKSRFSAAREGHEYSTLQLTLTTLKKRGVTTSDGRGNWRLITVPDAYLAA